MLKVDLESDSRNYLDYLGQFVIEILQTEKLDVVTELKIADLLLTRFGLKIPIKAVQHVLRRFAKKGWLVKPDGVYLAAESLPRVDLSSRRAKASAEIQIVYSRFIQEASQIGLAWNDIDVERALIAFLSQFTVECLRAYIYKTSIPRIPDRSSKELFIIGRVVRQAHANRDPFFESFIVLVKGQMYSNALLCPDLESLEKKFQNVSFYLDTPLILNLLGLQGEESQRSASELVALLLKLKGIVAVFEHTFSEIEVVLKAAIQNFDNPKATGGIIRELRKSGRKITDLMLAKDNLEARLAHHDIKRVSTPVYETGFQISESNYQDALQAAISYKSERAVLNDINSIRSIYVLRRGREPNRLEDAVAVFVTSNSALARVAFELGKEHNSTREVSSIISAYSLANVAWLKAPLEAPSLPAQETLALCYAALEPSSELFERYVKEMDNLLEAGVISREDHAILRLSPSAHDELMTLTLGDEDALTVGGVKEILAHVKAFLTAQQTAEHEAQLIAISATAEHQQSQLQATVHHLQSEADGLRSTVTRYSAREGAIQRMCESVARLAAGAIVVFVMLVLFVGALAGAGVLPTIDKPPDWIRYSLLALTVTAVAWGVYSWYSGTVVRSLHTKIKQHIAQRLFCLLVPPDA